MASSTIHWGKYTCKSNMESSAVFEGAARWDGWDKNHVIYTCAVSTFNINIPAYFVGCFRDKGWKPLVKQTWGRPKCTKVNGAGISVFPPPNVGRPEKHSWLFKMFTATFFSTVCFVLLPYFPPYVGFWKVVVACLKMGFSPCKGKQTACW